VLRYTLAALALKTFSLNDASRHLYRQIGNVLGARKRESVGDLDTRVERGDLLLELGRKHGALRDSDRLLEIGTGWMHWFSLYAALFYDLRITGLDVWDNRQFSALLAAARKLRPVLERRGENPAVLARVDRILQSHSMEDLYSRLGFEYVIQPQGSLAQFAAGSFDTVISFHVLEHVPRKNVETLLGDMHRILRPGGCAIHQIGIDDHLAHYDRRASKKQYLKYSDRTWQAFFENDVQYINRLQASEWQKLFADAGLTLIDRIAEVANVDSLRIHPRFGHLPREDHGCTILTLVYRKPQGH
jgi:SAM-dependent methyltransferase